MSPELPLDICKFGTFKSSLIRLGKDQPGFKLSMSYLLALDRDVIDRMVENTHNQTWGRRLELAEAAHTALVVSEELFLDFLPTP